jgi:hypothetical protein
MKFANRQLRKVFSAMGLEPSEVLEVHPGEAAETENRRLNTLLDWVLAWQAWPDRSDLERRGYCHPPISHCINPEADWVVFEHWVKGQSVAWRYEEVFGPIVPLCNLKPEEVESALHDIQENLWSRHVSVEYEERLPAKLAYMKLSAYLRDAWFDVLDDGTVFHITGCDGYCPGCFQRPWCEAGQAESWPEDARHGMMVYPDDIKPFIASGCREG